MVNLNVEVAVILDKSNPNYLRNWMNAQLIFKHFKHDYVFNLLWLYSKKPSMI